MPKKILFVDDETDLRKVSALRLRKSGYDVFEAGDGQEALDQARSNMPDLIFLDVFLPVMNGDEVTRILKQDADLKKVPIVLISAASKNLEERARSCGADDFLAKAFDSGALVAMTEKHVGR